MSRILIVEDEQDLAGLIEYNLHQAGYETEHAPTGAGALARARANPPDLVLLDLMLPDLAGTDVLRMLKADQQHPAHAGGGGQRQGPGERPRAGPGARRGRLHRQALQRARAAAAGEGGDAPRPGGDAATPGASAGGDIQLDIGRHEVLVKGEPVILTALEFRLLRTLLERPERVQTREVLLSDVWGIQAEIHTRTVDTHIKRLREKLGPAGDIIETVRGVGYKLTTRPAA